MEMKLLLCLASILVFTVSAERETHRLKARFDGEVFLHDIVFEKSENIATDTVGQKPGYKGFIPTVNFHDYNTNHVVFKDIEHGICLLTNIPFHRPAFEDYSQEVLDYSAHHKATYNKTILSNGEVEAKAGKRIGDFCQDYKTLWMDLIMNVGTNSIRAAAEDEPEPCLFNCSGICLITLDTGYQTASPDTTFG